MQYIIDFQIHTFDIEVNISATKKSANAIACWHQVRQNVTSYVQKRYKCTIYQLPTTLHSIKNDTTPNSVWNFIYKSYDHEKENLNVMFLINIHWLWNARYSMITVISVDLPEKEKLFSKVSSTKRSASTNKIYQRGISG